MKIMPFATASVAAAMVLMSGSVSAAAYQVGDGLYGDFADFTVMSDPSGSVTMAYDISGATLLTANAGDYEAWIGSSTEYFDTYTSYPMLYDGYDGLLLNVTNDSGQTADFGLFVNTMTSVKCDGFYDPDLDHEYVCYDPQEPVNSLVEGYWLSDGLVSIADGSTAEVAFNFDSYLDLDGNAYSDSTVFSGVISYGLYARFTSAVLPDPENPDANVSEPSILALLGAGLFGLGYLGRRRSC